MGLKGVGRSGHVAKIVEHMLLPTLIAAACVIAFKLLGLELADLFTSIADAIEVR